MLLLSSCTYPRSFHRGDPMCRLARLAATLESTGLSVARQAELQEGRTMLATSQLHQYVRTGATVPVQKQQQHESTN